MTRISDIEEILKEVEEVISTISALYENAKTDGAVTQISKAKIKSALEHLRSILDYCALEAYLHVYGKNPGKLYFPYAKNETLFHTYLAKNFKSLPQKNKKIYELIASLQPHVSGSNWLIDLCEYTNTNKHNNLTPQIKRTKDSVNIGNVVKLSGNSTVSFTNSTINGMPIGKDQSKPVIISDSMTNEEIYAQLNPNLYVHVTRISEEIKFFIEGSSNDALEFIQNAKIKISEFVSQLYLEINR